MFDGLEERSCLFHHSWGKWETVKVGHDGYFPYIVIQEKECKRCGKIKVRKAKAI